MSKVISLTDPVTERLNEIKAAYTRRTGKIMSYDKIVRMLLRESERWKNPVKPKDLGK